MLDFRTTAFKTSINVSNFPLLNLNLFYHCMLQKQLPNPLIRLETNKQNEKSNQKLAKELFTQSTSQSQGTCNVNTYTSAMLE